MKYNNKFLDGEKVRNIETGKRVTISNWAYIPKLSCYIYFVDEEPSTFFYEDELTRKEVEG